MDEVTAETRKLVALARQYINAGETMQRLMRDIMALSGHEYKKFTNLVSQFDPGIKPGKRPDGSSPTGTSG